MNERKVAPDSGRQFASDGEIIRFARQENAVRIIPLNEVELEVEERLEIVDRIEEPEVGDVPAPAKEERAARNEIAVAGQEPFQLRIAP